MKLTRTLGYPLLCAAIASCNTGLDVPPAIAGHWTGAAVPQPGQKLTLTMDLLFSNDSIVGICRRDITVGYTDSLSDYIVGGTYLHPDVALSMTAKFRPPATFQGTVNVNTMTGTLTVGGQSVPIQLDR